MSLSLRQWRRVNELSQEKMASLLNIHVNTYQNWEESPGKISVGKAFEIAKILNVSIGDIDFMKGGKN